MSLRKNDSEQENETSLTQSPPLAFQTAPKTQEHQTQETRQTTMTNLYFLSLLVTNLVVTDYPIYTVPAVNAHQEWFDNYYAEQRKHGSGVLMVHSNWIARIVVDGKTNDFTLHSLQIGQQDVTWYDRTVREWATNEWHETLALDMTYWTTNSLQNLHVTNVMYINTTNKIGL